LVIKIYKALLKHFGPQGWWPINGIYDPGKKAFTPSEKFEIAAGAILTQNTAWTNVEKAFSNLRASCVLEPQKILKISPSKLKKLIRPAGYYNQKAERLKSLADFVLEKQSDFSSFSRNELLAVKGIGPETADSILLYACGKLYFVVDAYTRRLLDRTTVLCEGDYETIRAFFEARLPRDSEIYKEYHALIVALAKEFCRKNPVCAGCPVFSFCRYGKREK
jgi:endonuclease-3 related protein